MHVSVKGEGMGWRSRVVEVGRKCSQRRWYSSWALKHKQGFYSLKKNKGPPKQRKGHEKRRGQRRDVQETAKNSILPEERMLGSCGAVGWGLEA